MRILYLCADLGIPVLGSKGAALHVRSIASALDRLGHDVVVVAPSLTGSLWDRPAAFDVEVVHVPPSDAVGAAARGLKAFAEGVGEPGTLAGDARRILYDGELRRILERKLERAGADLIVERASLFGTAGVRVATSLRVPLLLELNAPLALEHSTYRSGALHELALAAERFAIIGADRVLPVSGELADHAVSLGARRERVHVLPNGVDAELFSPGPSDPSTRSRLGLGDGPVLGFVGGLRPWHGLETLPALLARLLERHPSAQLVVAGDGPLKADLELEFELRGLCDHVVLTGAVPYREVPSLLREVDVALAPYPVHDHPFYFSPLKLFEYMACGAAVVAPAVGQIAELARHDETALLYPAGDLDALVSACARLLDDPALRRRLGESAAGEVRALHTWSDKAEIVASLGEELSATRRLALR